VEEHFLDTNVLLRHVLADHPDHSPRAVEFFRRVERGEVRVHLADTVIFEAVFTLERSYRRPKPLIRDSLLPLIDLPNIVLPGKQRFHQVFDYYVDLNVSFADAYHAVVLLHRGLDEVLSFDRHFDRIPGITRIEP
jgi:predicted nucleic acid-binding protein